METTKENVKSQLMYEWNENEDGEEVKGAQLMTEAEASAMIEKYQDVFDHCKMMRSYAYYTADRIREAHNATT